MYLLSLIVSFHALSPIASELEKSAVATHFEDDKPQKTDDQLYLSLNIDGGTRLELSDGSAYEVRAEDRIYSAYWITPFPIEITDSEDPKYPLKITNLKSGTWVFAKKITRKEMLQKDEEEPDKGYFKQKKKKTKPSSKPKKPKIKKKTQAPAKPKTQPIDQNP